MFRNAISGALLAAGILLAGPVIAADTATLHQVYETAQAGKINEARGMMQQVLKEHPNSAKAHFVDAELLAKAGHPEQAREELAAAEKLEPGLPFAKPQSVQELREQTFSSNVIPGPISASPAPQSGFPWGMLALMMAAIAMITVFFRAITARNTPPSPLTSTGPSTAIGQPYPNGGYAPATPATPGSGGIMSSLATGAALGAGMVAGEALVHHFIDGNGSHASPEPTPSFAGSATSAYDMGGSDFGIASNTSWDDNANLADISSGDDWS